MKWATREKAKVDRIACPWLIKRFVDKDAEFLYLPHETNWNELKGAIPFDAPGVELGHHGRECSFDAILKKYNLTDPALLMLARIVRAADTADKSLAPEGYGLEAIADGFRRIARDDFENQRLQFPVYDALYAHCQARLAAG
jgi:hypothetical protein